MDAQGRTTSCERSSFNSNNDAVNNNELPSQDCRASDCRDYEYSDDNNMTCYGSGHGDFSPNLHHHMTAGSSSSTYDRAAESHAPAGVAGPSGGAATPSKPAVPSFFAVGDREELKPQAPPMNHVNEQPANLGTDSLMPNPQQHAHQRFCNFLQEVHEDLERTLETLNALEHISCPLLSEDDEEGVGTEDDADDEDEDEDEDMNVGEDDDLVGANLDQDDDADEEEEEEDYDDGDDDAAEAEGQNGNEELGVMLEAPGNINGDIVAMPQEGGDGLDVDDILAALGMDVYEPQPPPDQHQPQLVDARPSSCSICLEDFEPGDLLGVLDCNHKFHYVCVREWLTRRNSCPLCRNIGLEIGGL